MEPGTICASAQTNYNNATSWHRLNNDSSGRRLKPAVLSHHKQTEVHFKEWFPVCRDERPVDSNFRKASQAFDSGAAPNRMVCQRDSLHLSLTSFIK